MPAQHWSIPGWSQTVAFCGGVWHNRKPPGVMGTHFPPGQSASTVQSPELLVAPPEPIELLVAPPEPLALLVALLDVPAAPPVPPVVVVVVPLVDALVVPAAPLPDVPGCPPVPWLTPALPQPVESAIAPTESAQARKRMA